MTNSYPFYESKLLTVTKYREWLPRTLALDCICVLSWTQILHIEYTELTSLNFIKEICHEKDRLTLCQFNQLSLLPDQETKTVTQKKKKIIVIFFLANILHPDR